MKVIGFAFALIFALTSRLTSAKIITFVDLPGINADPMPSPYIEGGFSVTPVSGDWRIAKFFGNPIPDIFGIVPSATVEIASVSFDPFMFSSVDLADGGATPTGATYSIEGFLEGSSIFQIAGGLLPRSVGSNIFVTITNPATNVSIDRLQITMQKDAQFGGSFNIDNIVVDVVPEPRGFILASIALLCGISLAVAEKRAAWFFANYRNSN